jgi:hypothetical protein
MKNLITDKGMDKIGTSSINGSIWYCVVGTGTATPQVSDTALQAKTGPAVQDTSEVVSGTGAPLYNVVINKSYQFPQGSVVGNIAEVGVCGDSSGNNLFSRARIIDGAGTPTTITVTSIDQLTVYYRLTCTQPLTDVSGSVTVSGTAYPYTFRPARAGDGPQRWAQSSHAADINTCEIYAANAALGPITGYLTGTDYAGYSTVSFPAYVPGSFYRDSVVVFNPDKVVTGGIGGLGFFCGRPFGGGQGWPCGQFKFASPIPKTNTQQFTITIRHSWVRSP